MTEKMAVVCNGDTPASIMPTLIFSSSGLSLDYEVHIFICPAGARWMVKGELEKLGTCAGYFGHPSGLLKGKQVEGVTLIEYHAVLSSSHNTLGTA